MRGEEDEGAFQAIVAAAATVSSAMYAVLPLPGELPSSTTCSRLVFPFYGSIIDNDFSFTVQEYRPPDFFAGSLRLQVRVSFPSASFRLGCIVHRFYLMSFLCIATFLDCLCDAALLLPAMLSAFVVMMCSSR